MLRNFHKTASTLFLIWTGILCQGVLFTSCKNSGKSKNEVLEHGLKTATESLYATKGRKALVYIDSVYNGQKKVLPYYKYRLYDFKSLYYYMTGMPDSNRLYIDSMLYTLEHNNLTEKYPAEYAAALNARGDHYYTANDLDNAFEYYYRGKIAALNSKDSCTFSNQSYHLGMITYRQEKYSDAIGYFKQSFTELRACTDDSLRYFHAQELLNNIALAYTHTGEYDSALHYYNRSIEVNSRAGLRFGPTVQKYATCATGVIYGNLAKVFVAQNKTEEAIALFRKSIAINSQPGFENRDAALVRLQLAAVYAGAKDPDKCYALLHEVEQWLDTVHDRNVEMNWHYQSYQFQTMTGNTAEAMIHLRAYLAIKDSTDITAKKLKLTDYKQLLENQERRYQLTLLRKDNQVKRLYLAVTLGLGTMALAIIVLIYIYYRKSAKNVKELTLLNRRVNEQNAQLETAMRQVETTMGQLQQSNRDKDRILHAVAHDLRNPIAGVISLCTFILKDEPNETNKKFLELIIKTSRNSLTLIDELLAFSGEIAREQPNEKELSEVSNLISQATDLLQFKAYEKKQKLRLTLSENPLYILTNQQRIRRVFSNLIANAIKFSPEFAAVDIVVTSNNGHGLIEVKDSGIGIPDRLQPFVFNPFTEAKRQGTSGEQSFGLGLSICKQIVEAESGRIWFESVEGKGSSFFVELPLHQLTAEEQERISNA